MNEIYKGLIDFTEKTFGIIDGFKIPELHYSDDDFQINEYGDLSNDELNTELEKLRDVYNEKYPDEKEEIRQIINYPVLIKANAGILTNRIAYKEKSHEWENELLEKACILLERQRVSVPVKGAYDALNNEIIIFNKAFGDPPYKVDIRFTIAQQFFHAVHCMLSPATYSEDSYYANVIREALSEYFSFVFCVNKEYSDIDGIRPALCRMWAFNREDYWNQNIFSNIPCTKAVFCVSRNNRYVIVDIKEYYDKDAIEKMLRTLEIGKTDMKRAYEYLVPEDYRKIDSISCRSDKNMFVGI